MNSTPLTLESLKQTVATSSAGRKKGWLAFFLAGSLLPILPLSAQTERFWENASGGNWMTDTNWVDEEIPSTGERAVFDLDQDPAYTVELDDSTSIGSLQVMNDNLLLDIASGETLTLTDLHAGNSNTNNNTFTATASLMVGRGTETEGHHGVLTVGEGTLSMQSFLIGGTTDSIGVLNVTGSNTVVNQLETNGDRRAILGYLGEATLNVSDGAQMTLAARLLLTRHGSADATVNVVGAGSLLVLNGGAEVGHRGDAWIEIRDGGRLESAGMTISERNREATVLIDNATAEFVGLIQMGRYRDTGNLRIINGSEVEVTSIWAGRNNVTDAIDGTGVVEVTGAGSTLTTSGVIALGGETNVDRDGIGFLTVEEGGAVSIAEELRSWSRGTTTIRSGGSVEASQYLASSGSVFSIDGGTFQANSWNTDPGSIFELTLHTGQFGAPVVLGDAFFGGGDAIITNSIFELSLAPGFSADLEDVFGVMQYFGDLTGMFDGLDEGDVLTVGGYEFQIGYGSGSGDMITLTVIPEPNAALLLLAGVGLLAGLKRHRRQRS